MFPWKLLPTAAFALALHLGSGHYADPEFVEVMHGAHLKYRAKENAKDMRYMWWDEDLAREAQSYAKRCNFGHDRRNQAHGENIFASTQVGAYQRSVDDWVSEKDMRRCGCRRKLTFSQCCGHYTQVVWSTSSWLGCGAAECPFGVKGLDRSLSYVVVCRYDPPGNLVRTPAFQKGSKRSRCSKCPTGWDECWQGMCH